MRIDLNADVGEGYDDVEVMTLVSSVNIACGAHAGDEDTMKMTVARAAALGLAIGAHPGYDDRESFGRRRIDMPLAEVERLVAAQIERLAAITSSEGARLTHVKPHGALYNQAAADPALTTAIARAVRSVDPSLRLVLLAGSAMPDAAVEIVEEGFADRRYTAEGTLAPRELPGAVIDDADVAAAQALAIARGEALTAIDGTTVVVAAESICIHADSPGARRNARAVRSALEAAGVTIAARR